MLVEPDCTLFYSMLSDPLSSNGASDSASGVGSNNLTVGEEGVGSGAAATTNTSPSRSQGAAAPQAAASAQQVCSLSPISSQLTFLGYQKANQWPLKYFNTSI